jgi:gliding motility-associated lipoprotein GldH
MDRITAPRIRVKINNLLVGLLLCVAMACSHNSVYDEYRSFPDTGWEKGSIARFEVDITQPGIPCNMLVNIRHNSHYPYQNFWMFISTTTPDGIITKDTIECYLADNRGKWLGSGLSSVYNMPVLIKQNTVFSKAGKYTIVVRQGMRDDVLPGITNVGLEIDKVGKH